MRYSEVYKYDIIEKRNQKLLKVNDNRSFLTKEEAIEHAKNYLKTNFPRRYKINDFEIYPYLISGISIGGIIVS